MMLAIVGVVMLLAAQEPAIAPDWQVVGIAGKAPDRRIQYIDGNSVQLSKSGNFVVSYLNIFEKLRPNGATKERAFVETDCPARKNNLLELWTYTPGKGGSTTIMTTPRPLAMSDLQFSIMCASDWSKTINLGSTSPEQFAATHFAKP